MRTEYENLYINPDEDDMGRQLYQVAFDMDSVLNDMGDNLGNFLSGYFGKSQSHPSPYRQFNFTYDGVDPKEIFPAVTKYTVKHGHELNPVPYMNEVLEYVVRKTNKPIIIVTARPPETAEVTYKWLAEHVNVPWICYMVHGKSKNYILENHKVSAFVDDRYKTVYGLLSRIEFPILMQQEWNQGRPYELPFQIRDLRDMIPWVNLLTRTVLAEWPLSIPYPARKGV